MQSFPKPLTAEEEQMYLLRYREGDLNARDMLIERNLRLVAHIAKKYNQAGRDMEEILAVGVVGLVKAVHTFAMDKGRKLATYAAKCIENAILSQMRLWWRTNLPRAEKNSNGVFWHKFPRIYTSFVPLQTAM